MFTIWFGCFTPKPIESLPRIPPGRVTGYRLCVLHAIACASHVNTNDLVTPGVGVLGKFGAILGLSWKTWGILLSTLGLYWDGLGATWVHLAATWVHFGV